MYLENDPYRHHHHSGLSPPGSLSRLSPQDSEFSDIDDYGRPVLPGVDPHYQSTISNNRRYVNPYLVVVLYYVFGRSFCTLQNVPSRRRSTSQIDELSPPLVRVHSGPDSDQDIEEMLQQLNWLSLGVKTGSLSAECLLSATLDRENLDQVKSVSLVNHIDRLAMQKQAC